MFGFVGVVKSGRENGKDIRAIQSALVAPSRRAGWTDTALIQGPDCVLSAVEPDFPSTMPTPSMQFDDGISVALFGTIYNDLKAGESPVDFLHRIYVERGVGCFSELNGTFSLVVQDTGAKKIFVAVDRLGTRPLLYFRGNGHLLISPDLRSFTESGEVPKRLNPSALAAALATRHMHGDDTYVLGVRSLNPGCYLEIGPDSVEEKQYWDYAIEPAEDRSEEDERGEFGTGKKSVVGGEKGEAETEGGDEYPLTSPADGGEDGDQQNHE